ncbi:AI-2E family transporter [Halosimplex sp. TS25]|uniref:AI-2E family transporter n=1 Tax=Halosimplex rarum TaxID=3396619 RepID=UPI0039EBCED6
MSARPNRSNRFLTAVGILAGVLSVLIVLPFLNWILAGAILAYVLTPIDDRLSHRLGSGPSAGVTILVGLFLVVLPVVAVMGVAASQANRLLGTVEPGAVSRIDDVIATRFGIQVDIAVIQDALTATIKTGATGLLGNFFSILGGLPELFIGVTVTFFVLFYLLKDGERTVEWIRAVVPVEPAVREELFEGSRLLLYNSLVGTVTVAGAQAVLLGVAFFALGISNVVFWIAATFVTGMIPLVGASIVWIPATLYLLVVDRPVAAVGLLLFGAVAISTVDNVLRPLVMERGTQLSPAVTIVGIFGGIAVFGFVGLFVGPIVLGMTKLVVEILVREPPRSAPVDEG